MVRTKVEFTGSYRAKDQTGAIHTINVYTEYLESTSIHDTQEKWLAGMQSHQMASTGGPVNVAPDGTLVEVATGRKMTRI